MASNGTGTTGHKVSSVADLYNDARVLLNTNVLGQSNVSADGVINTLVKAINNLKDNWEGADAGVQINDVVTVTNAMITLRNALADLAVAASEVACTYRNIQRSNGATSFQELTKLSYTESAKLQAYTDNRDTVRITSAAQTGYQNISTANTDIATFITNVKSKKEDILNNWTQGPGRENAITAFDTFVSKYSSEYKPTLEKVLSHIKTALGNYGI